MAEAKKQRGKNAHWKLLNWALFVPSAHNSQVHDDSSINAGWLADRSMTGRAVHHKACLP